MKTLPVRSKRLSKRWVAFTLVELLVSMTLLAVILIILASLLNSVVRTWGSVRSDSERHRNGRALTDFIVRELRQAVIPVEGLTTTTTQADLQLLVNPDSVLKDANGDNYHNGDIVFWQAPLATENTCGDLAEVGYFVRWIPDGSASTPTLCRFFVNPSLMTGNPPFPSANPDYLIYTKKDWLTPGLIDNVAPATKIRDYTGLFAENVVGLWIRSFGLDNSEPAPNHAVFDSRVGYDLTIGSGPNSVKRKHYLPAMVKVSIAQVDSRYAPRLAAAKTKIREMVNAATDASAFYSAAQAASTDASVRGWYPGVRIYSADVYLDNAK